MLQNFLEVRIDNWDYSDYLGCYSQKVFANVTRDLLQVHLIELWNIF